MIDTKPQMYVFVLMPFSNEYENVYNFCIKPSCHENNITCERLDELIFSEGMLKKIYTQISKADFIIADMSERNPNVFYEVGYAHALNKKVIMITNNAEDIPFDLKHFQHIIYKNNDLLELKKELARKVMFYKSSITSNNDKDASENIFNYEISIQGTELHKDQIMVVNSENQFNDNDLSFNIDLRNIDNNLKKSDNNQICLLVEKELINSKDIFYPFVDKKFFQVDLGSIDDLYPKQAQALNVNFETTHYLSKKDYKNKKFKCILRAFRESEVIDIPFQISICFKE